MPVRLTTPRRAPGYADLKRDSRVKFDKIFRPTVQGRFNAQIPLEMLITGVFDDDFDTDYYSQAVRYNPADYDGVVAGWFQGCFTNFENKTVSLIDENGVVYASVTSVGPTAFQRFRGAFTPDPVNAHTYRFFVPGDPLDPFDLEFFDCKILIDQVNASKTKIQILLVADTTSFGGTGIGANENNQAAFAGTAASCAYDYEGLPALLCGAGTRRRCHNLFLKEEAKFATIISWELEVIGYHFQTVPCNCLANCQAALFNATTGLQVTGAVVGPWFPGAVPANPELKFVSFANNALNFTDLDEFEVKFILDPLALPDGCAFRMMRAALYVKLVDANIKAQVFHKLSIEGNQAAATKNYPETRYLHEPTKYNAGTQFFHEATGSKTGGAGNVVTLHVRDLGVTDVGVVGANVAASGLVLDATRTRWRSGALALTDQNRYFGRDERVGGAGVTTHAHHFLIAEVPVAP